MKDEFPFEEQIEMVMNEFNFKEVHNAMFLLNKEIFNFDLGEKELPSVKKIKAISRKLLEKVCEFDGDSQAMMAGFIAERNDSMLSLKYVLEYVEV